MVLVAQIANAAACIVVGQTAAALTAAADVRFAPADDEDVRTDVVPVEAVAVHAVAVQVVAVVVGVAAACTVVAEASTDPILAVGKSVEQVSHPLA